MCCQMQAIACRGGHGHVCHCRRVVMILLRIREISSRGFDLSLSLRNSWVKGSKAGKAAQGTMGELAALVDSDAGARYIGQLDLLQPIRSAVPKGVKGRKV